MSASSNNGPVRKLARALLKPLDGRIADVNRRVGDATASVAEVTERVDVLSRELSAHTATSTESNAYVGREIRHLDETLEALRETVARLATRDYVEQLDAAAEAPLSELEGPVANIVNRANGHQGFAAQAGLWFNPPVTVQLGPASARLADVNERVVEVPWAFAALSRLAPPARVLEIGGAESTFALSVASLGYEITALDLHELPYSHPNLTAVTGRLEDWQGPRGSFDAAFLISTIEHFGLGAYGEETRPSSADRDALTQVRELLSDEGFLVLTTPYGRGRVTPLERIYDNEMLDELLAGWDVIERRTIVRVEERTWQAVDGEEPPGDEPGVALIVAVPARPA